MRSGLLSPWNYLRPRLAAGHAPAAMVSLWLRARRKAFANRRVPVEVGTYPLQNLRSQ